jgi:hypothetical protein
MGMATRCRRGPRAGHRARGAAPRRTRGRRTCCSHARSARAHPHGSRRRRCWSARRGPARGSGAALPGRRGRSRTSWSPAPAGTRRRGRLQRAGQVDTGVLDPDIDAAEPLDRVGQFGHGRGSVTSVGTARVAPPVAWQCRASSSRRRPVALSVAPAIPVRRTQAWSPGRSRWRASDHHHRAIQLPAMRWSPASHVTTPYWLAAGRSGDHPAAVPGAARPAASRRPSRRTRRRRGGCLLPRPAPDAGRAACAARCRRTG